jgi:type I restriction enzyme S subunit
MSEVTAHREADPSTGWRIRPLSEVLSDIQTGFASGKHNSEGLGVIHTRPMNITRNGALDLRDAKYVEDTSSRRLARGDVLFNNTNSPALVGKTTLIDTNAVLAFSNHMTRLRVDHSVIEAAFLALQLYGMWTNGFFEAICSNHVNQASVSAKRLRDVSVVVPSLPEQQRIVEILEEQLSRLDAALESVRIVREKAAQFRRSLLHAAFTGVLRDRNEFGIMGSEQWDWVPLRELTETTRPICYGVLKPGEFIHGGVPLARIVDIKNDCLDLTNAHRISESLDCDFARSRLDGGEILLSIQGTIGRVALVPEEAKGANISRTIAVIQPDSRVNNAFARYWLMWLSATNQFKIGGTTRNSLNISDIRNLHCPLPLADEQDRIVEILDTQFSRLDGSMAIADAVERQAVSLRRSLLHAAFTGKLTEQWREEHAHV